MNIRPGGSEGGVGKFLLGAVLSAVSLYFFFDSVHVTTRGSGWVSSGLRGFRGGGGGGGRGLWETTSMGIVFLPFFIGIVALFYDAKKKWAWVVTWIGLAIIVIEIVSRIRFLLEIKTSHLMIMLVTFAAGSGLMLQSYRDDRRAERQRRDDERDLGLGEGPGDGGSAAGLAGKAAGADARREDVR